MKRFLNRLSAGSELADMLAHYQPYPCVVMTIPRGGVPVGFKIAQKLNCSLGLVWVKKIGHPLSPELAIGAVSPDDVLIDYKSTASDNYIHAETDKIRTRFTELKKLLNDHSDKIELKGKYLILVDDGIATGHTIIAAIKILRKKMPKKIIVAVPVAPEDVIKTLNAIADDVIVLYHPEWFTGIGSVYEDFTQLTDEEVRKYLSVITQPSS
jgi:putative phosphoribosyl transferase